MKIAFFIFLKSLDFASIVWYCVVLPEVIKMNVITHLASSLFKEANGWRSLKKSEISPQGRWQNTGRIAMRQKSYTFSQAKLGLWSAVLLKRTMARQYRATRRCQKQLARNEAAYGVYGKASRWPAEIYDRRTERNLRKIRCSKLKTTECCF